MKKAIKTREAIFPMPVLMIGTFNEDGSVDVNAKVISSTDRIETTFVVGEELNKSEYDDKLPFVFENEEERQRIVGNPLGDVVDEKPIYIEQPTVEEKKHRGRPRKNKI